MSKVNAANYQFISFFLIPFSIFLSIFSVALADTTRFEQNVKNNEFGAGSTHVQTLACSDLSGTIENVTLSVSGLNASNVPLKLFFRKGSEDVTTPIVVAQRTSDTRQTGGRGIQRDVTFTFPQPIDVANDLCAGVTSVKMELHSYMTGNGSGSEYTYVYGSTLNPYAGGLASEGVNVPTSADMYFIINGQAIVNHAPTLSPIESQSVSEGTYMTLSLSSVDIDQSKDTTFTALNLPEGAIFSGKTLHWVPSFQQAGLYEDVVFTATDNGNEGLPVESDSQTVSFAVSEVSPTLSRFEQIIKNDSLGFGSVFYQSLRCADLESQIEKITLSITPLNTSNIPFVLQIARPGEDYDTAPKVLMRTATATTGVRSSQNDVVFSFNNPIDVEGELCNGVSVVNMRLSPLGNWSALNNYISLHGSLTNPYSHGGLIVDGFTTSKDAFFVINPHVQNNSAPELALVGNQTVNESHLLNFTVIATDPDNDPITLSATGLLSGATFNPTTGEFTWTPGYSDSGEYQVTFTATENTSEALSDSETITITVNNTNRPPELTPIGNQIISEGDILQFSVSATDADNDSMVLSANNLPAGSTFTPSTGLFYWNTDFDDAGNYGDIEFTATDNGIPMELDLELITITVGNVNRMPELTNPGPQTVLEDDSLSFTVSATDPDDDTVTLSATNLPTGATFNPANGEFTWTPSLADAGVYTVNITATDNGNPVESASTDVVITVGDNPTPTEQAQGLIETVVTIDIPQNVENSYLANLHKVEQFILEGKITSALNQLQAFINKVQQDYNQNRLTQEEYETLMEAAQNLIDDLTN